MKKRPKTLCSSSWLYTIDSFDIFSPRTMGPFLQYSASPEILEIPRYGLTISLQNDFSLLAVYFGGKYLIVTEQKQCNFGGSYTFFRCPDCSGRMRLLYCLEGRYKCRKCARLGYWSQRLIPPKRLCSMQNKITAQIKGKGGSDYNKPPYMHKSTFRRLRHKEIDYMIKSDKAFELRYPSLKMHV